MDKELMDPEGFVRKIKRKTRKKFNSEEKIRIVLEGLRGEIKISELCRREGIHQSQYYKWSKDFLETGKQRLNGDYEREANSGEVKQLKKQNDELKLLIVEISLKNRILKKVFWVRNKYRGLYEL